MSKTLVLLGALSYGTPAFGSIVMQKDDVARVDDPLADILLEDVRYSEGDGIEIRTFHEAPAGAKVTYDFTKKEVKGFEDPASFAPPSKKAAAPAASRHQIEEAGEETGEKTGDETPEDDTGGEGGGEDSGTGDLTNSELATKNPDTAPASTPVSRKAVQRAGKVVAKTK